ncbi:MAG: murein hydrolase activator EnvC family protein [Actinomycetota bacterium]
MQHPSRTISSLARAFLAALVVALLATVAPTASATSTKEQLDAAKRRYEQLKDEIAAEERRLSSLRSEMVGLAGRLETAEGRLEKAEDDLDRTRKDLAEARTAFEDLRAQLAERARAAYIEGPGNDLEFLLGATSLADLADRVQYVDALTQADLDLATKVQNLANRLTARAEDLEALTAEREQAVDDLNAQEDVLFGKLREQQEITDSIDAKLDEAKGLVARLSAQYQRELEALREESGGTTGGAGSIGGILDACPVDQPRVIYDGFGAPRYGGGYHPHAGNDIIAPQGTPIRAPFPGTTRSSYNTLGGNAVYVYGADGYVYNAHLSRYSSKSNGTVKTGDIIGYVGETGDTSTPHNHFEWHPKAMPSSWPTSPYGYRTIGSAVNPWPILQSVC